MFFNPRSTDQCLFLNYTTIHFREKVFLLILLMIKVLNMNSEVSDYRIVGILFLFQFSITQHEKVCVGISGCHSCAHAYVQHQYS